MSRRADQRRMLYEQRVEPLLGRATAYAYAIVRNRADADDALQEALLKGYLGWANYDPARSFQGWWFTLIRNCCLDLLRRRKVRRSLIPWQRVEETAVARSAGEDTDALLHSLAQLTPLQREILELRYFGDCSYRDIAEALGIPEGTVMSRLHAARQALALVYRRE